MRLALFVAIACLSCSVTGCSFGPDRVLPPSVDAALAGQKAVEAYDKNGDGSLSEEELETCPALLKSFSGLDVDQSRGLSGEEIATRIREWQATKAGLVSCRLRIMLDDRPLAGAEVLLEPCDFLQPGVLPATGVTTNQGYAQLSVAQEHLPAPTIRAVNWGFYNVKVVDGREDGGDTEDYAAGQSLGVEVTAIGKNETVIRLKSRG